MVAQEDALLRKLGEIEGRYEEIERLIADPAVASDSVRLVELSKEQGRLKGMVGKYRECKKAA